MEEQLKRQFGNKRPFSVPEGYFGEFTARMELLMAAQSRQAVAREVKMKGWKTFRPVLFAVASVTAAVVMVGAYFHVGSGMQVSVTSSLSPHTSVPSVQHDDFEQAVDYMMISTDDMYAYLADD